MDVDTGAAPGHDRREGPRVFHRTQHVDEASRLCEDAKAFAEYAIGRSPTGHRPPNDRKCNRTHLICD